MCPQDPVSPAVQGSRNVYLRAMVKTRGMGWPRKGTWLSSPLADAQEILVDRDDVSDGGEF